MRQAGQVRGVQTLAARRRFHGTAPDVLHPPYRRRYPAATEHDRPPRAAQPVPVACGPTGVWRMPETGPQPEVSPESMRTSS